VNGSKYTIISVKVPIRWESMSEYEQTRLSRITGRDTRVIRAFLGIIARHEQELLQRMVQRTGLLFPMISKRDSQISH